ncbi:hypothetical protein [Actinacidiphila yeochonensis]|uniref:hypothetical protein n=1 Tax=Actinacidiphila yeochonensis TaxID=89050 RepID=UPI0005673246|nr:hypothetical protein [Actinacidiphila yeochonensis]
MLLLGLLLLACTAAFTGIAIADNLSGGPDYTVTLLGQHVATMNGLALFCAGLGLALVFGLGCLMAVTGGALSRRKHRQYRAVRRDAAAVARERDELAARLDGQDRASAAPDTGGDPLTARTDYRKGSEGADDAGSTRARTRPRAHRARHLFGH